MISVFLYMLFKNRAGLLGEHKKRYVTEASDSENMFECTFSKQFQVFLAELRYTESFPYVFVKRNTDNKNMKKIIEFDMLTTHILHICLQIDKSKCLLHLYSYTIVDNCIITLKQGERGGVFR